MFKKEYEKYQITTRSLKYDFDEIERLAWKD